MRSSSFVVVGVLSATLLLATSGPLVGQDQEQIPVEEAAEPEGGFHRNHFGGVIGVSVRSDIDEVAPTIGLEYTRQFSPHWAATTYVELVSSQLERDIVLVVGTTYYPIPPLGLVLGVGVEGADKEVTHNGQPETESELAFLMRVGISYGFRVAPTASIAPTVLVDRVGDRTTVVLGMGLVVGF